MTALGAAVLLKWSGDPGVKATPMLSCCACFWYIIILFRAGHAELDPTSPVFIIDAHGRRSFAYPFVHRGIRQGPGIWRCILSIFKLQAWSCFSSYVCYMLAQSIAQDRKNPTISARFRSSRRSHSVCLSFALSIIGVYSRLGTTLFYIPFTENM